MPPGKVWTARGEREWRDLKRPWLTLCSTRMLFRLLFLCWYSKICPNWSSQLCVHIHHFVSSGHVWLLGQRCHQIVWHASCGDRPQHCQTTDRGAQGLNRTLSTLISQIALRKGLTLFLCTWHSNIKLRCTSSRLTWRSLVTKESCCSGKWATKQTETWFKSLSLSYATCGTTWWTKSQSDRWGNRDSFLISDNFCIY